MVLICKDSEVREEEICTGRGRNKNEVLCHKHKLCVPHTVQGKQCKHMQNTLMLQTGKAGVTFQHTVILQLVETVGAKGYMIF